MQCNVRMIYDRNFPGREGVLTPFRSPLSKKQFLLASTHLPFELLYEICFNDHSPSGTLLQTSCTVTLTPTTNPAQSSFSQYL